MTLEPQSSPHDHFERWFREARASGIINPDACALATTDENGYPSVRMVLMKAHDERGFAFFTSLKSDKSRELVANPKAAIVFYWSALGKQVRIKGPVEPVSDSEADAYFATRHPNSRLGAWASIQSHPMNDPGEFIRRVAEYKQQFAEDDIPRPPFWSGWRIIPVRIEFWQEGEFRLHERLVYLADDSGNWRTERLYP